MIKPTIINILGQPNVIVELKKRFALKKKIKLLKICQL